MIFFLVEYTCFDPQGADKVINALNKAAQYQIDNSITGVLTYHFSKPSMEEPEKLRFIEFYISEKAFWEHSMEPMVSKEIMVSFDPTIRKSFSWWAFYSNDIQTKVKETITTLKGIEVSPIQKNVNLNYKIKFKLDPVLFVGKWSKKQNTLKIFLKQNWELLSESSIYQIMFKDPIGAFHIISLWPSQDDIINSLIQLDLPKTELQSQIYLENPTNQLKKIFKPWNPKFFTKPEAGYCLHPKYYQIKND